MLKNLHKGNIEGGHDDASKEGLDYIKYMNCAFSALNRQMMIEVLKISKLN